MNPTMFLFSKLYYNNCF